MDFISNLKNVSWLCFHITLFPSLMMCYWNGHGLKYSWWQMANVWTANKLDIPNAEAGIKGPMVQKASKHHFASDMLLFVAQLTTQAWINAEGNNKKHQWASPKQ